VTAWVLERFYSFENLFVCFRHDYYLLLDFGDGIGSFVASSSEWGGVVCAIVAILSSKVCVRDIDFFASLTESFHVAH